VQLRRCDALIFGGGFAGLWILEKLRQRGYDALLLESKALGGGQSIQAQGIIHGGGKYALRGVRDFAAVRSIRDMPARWRAHLLGEAEPHLAPARVLSQRCLLWVPKGGWLTRLSAYALLPVVQRGGLLHTPPVRLARQEWPEVLRDSARVVYSMAEPVLSVAATLAALAKRQEGRLLRYQAGRELERLRIELKASEEHSIIIEETEIEEPLELRPRVLVFAAGAGNEALLRRAELEGASMQRRPLRMVLVRGRLPVLFGHAVAGGKTAMTVTSHPLETGGVLADGQSLVWQVGGELAERFAGRDDPAQLRQESRAQFHRLLPGWSPSGLEMSSYTAVRAEARSTNLRRPSGVHVKWVHPGALVAWPTKMALTPLLGDEVGEEVARRLGPPAQASSDAGRLATWPKPKLAKNPWEEEGLEWSPVL
jgi:glycine/D-amino acid oxidase-like deaminating enzyme